MPNEKPGGRCSLDLATRPVDSQALLKRESLSTTPIYSHVGQARMERVVRRS